MKSNKIFRLILAALFAALNFISVLIVHIPLPGVGFINPGDAFGLTAGIILGPVYGGLAAGIGSALSDIILGYTIYVPATFVIKALSAVIAYFISNKLLKKHKTVSLTLSAITGEAIMVVGYFFYECLIYSIGAATVSIPYNCIQGIGSAIIAIIIIISIRKTGILERMKIK